MVLLAHLALAGPACLPGRESPDGVHCCWPAQRWEAGACAGAPACPEGLVADAGTCRSTARIVGALETTTGKSVVAAVTPSAAPPPDPYPWTVKGTRVHFGDPQVIGGIAEVAVRDALLAHATEIRGCVARGGATATLRVVADAKGQITTATARDADPPEFGACLSTAARAWRLPPVNGEMAVVTLPLRVGD